MDGWACQRWPTTSCPSRGGRASVTHALLEAGPKPTLCRDEESDGTLPSPGRKLMLMTTAPLGSARGLQRGRERFGVVVEIRTTFRANFGASCRKAVFFPCVSKSIRSEARGPGEKALGGAGIASRALSVDDAGGQRGTRTGRSRAREPTPHSSRTLVSRPLIPRRWVFLGGPLRTLLRRGRQSVTTCVVSHSCSLAGSRSIDPPAGPRAA